MSSIVEDEISSIETIVGRGDISNMEDEEMMDINLKVKKIENIYQGYIKKIHDSHGKSCKCAKSGKGCKCIISLDLKYDSIINNFITLDPWFENLISINRLN